MVTPDAAVRAVDGLLTGWHEPRGDPPADAGGGRRPRRRSSWPTGRRSTAATCGTSSATATCAPSRDEPDAVSPTDDRATATRAARRPPRGALRRAPAGRGDRRAGRRAARHHRQRRPPAPQRAGTTTASSRPASCRRRRPSGVAARSCTRRPARPTRLPEGLRRADQRAAGLPRRRPTPRCRPPVRQAPRSPHRRGPGPAGDEADAGRQGRRAHRDPRRGRLPRESWRRRSPASTGSSSTTARSGPSPSATARRARSELEFIRTVLEDADVERVQHMVAGDRGAAPTRCGPAEARTPRAPARLA